MEIPSEREVTHMKLSQLMIGVDAAYADGEMEIEGITCDSRRVKPGWAFVCIQGTAADGHAFAQKAVEAGRFPGGGAAGFGAGLSVDGALHPPGMGQDERQLVRQSG